MYLTLPEMLRRRSSPYLDTIADRYFVTDRHGHITLDRSSRRACTIQFSSAGPDRARRRSGDDSSRSARAASAGAAAPSGCRRSTAESDRSGARRSSRPTARARAPPRARARSGMPSRRWQISGDRRRVLQRDPEGRLRRGRAVDEQPHRLVPRQRFGRERLLRRRDGERKNVIRRLARRAQRLAAGRQDLQVRPRLQQLLGEVRAAPTRCSQLSRMIRQRRSRP